jgi:hypothetical protein
MAMPGSDGETDMNHDYSKDWIAKQPEGSRMERRVSSRTVWWCRQRMLGGGCSLAAASQAWERMVRMFLGYAYAERKIL